MKLQVIRFFLLKCFLNQYIELTIARIEQNRIKITGVFTMKIGGTNIQEILQSYYAKKGSIQQRRDEEEKSDNLTLSSDGQLFKKTLQRLKEEPEIRQEVVNELRDKIQSGEYRIEEEAIAPHMVKLLLSQELDEMH